MIPRKAVPVAPTSWRTEVKNTQKVMHMYTCHLSRPLNVAAQENKGIVFSAAKASHWWTKNCDLLVRVSISRMSCGPGESLKMDDVADMTLAGLVRVVHKRLQ